MSIPRLTPDRNQVSISNSILKHFGVIPHHETFAPLDEILAQNKDRKICLFLFDGFGKAIQRKLKAQCPFIVDHARFDIEAVYPPTTVAATTALLSGLYPIETSWLGWTQYFSRANLYVEMFSGRIEGTDTVVKGSKPSDILPYKSIFDQIDEVQGKGFARRVMGFDCLDESGEASAGVFFERTEEVLRDPSCGFLYSYWTEPDHTLHAEGICENVRKKVAVIDESVAAICRRNPDVVFLFIADHGHLPVTFVDIRDYPDFIDCLVQPRFSIEPRFATFLVKPGREDDFVKAFDTHFAKDFELYSRDQIYAEHIFGYGERHPLADEFIGDYTLIAKANKAFYSGYNFNGMLSTHAGATEEERILSLGIANA